MRWRFSAWDVVFIVLTGLQVAMAIWVLTTAPETVPVHWGPDGQPDGFSRLSAGNVLLMLFITAPSYLIMRLIDLVMFARKPQYYGFLTTMAGGLAVCFAMLDAGLHAATLGWLRTPPVLSIVGLMYVFMGGQFWLTPTERIPWSGGTPAIANTPTAQEALRRGMAISFAASGLLTIGLGLLPGMWHLVALAPLTLGPFGGIVAGMVRSREA